MHWDILVWWMSLVPLAVLAVQRARGVRFARIWWVVALTIGVSWLADCLGLWLGSPRNWTVSFFYPSAQASLLAFALLKRGTAVRFVGLIAAMGLVSAASHGLVKPEDGLRTAAWIGGGVIAWDAPLPPTLRHTLLMTFGLGWFAWFVYTLNASVATWAVYQGVRALGIAVFTVGACAPQEAA